MAAGYLLRTIFYLKNNANAIFFCVQCTISPFCTKKPIIFVQLAQKNSDGFTVRFLPKTGKTAVYIMKRRIFPKRHPAKIYDGTCSLPQNATEPSCPAPCFSARPERPRRAPPPLKTVFSTKKAQKERKKSGKPLDKYLRPW